MEILRGVAHVLSPAPREGEEKPKSVKEAQERRRAHLEELELSVPRYGHGAKIGAFVDHIVKLCEESGEHLFYCFSDERIPATTNELEGFWGKVKRVIRSTMGSGSTTKGLATNLGEDYLLALHEAETLSERLEQLPLSAEDYRKARAALEIKEAPARHRRSLVRHTDRHLNHLLERWMST